MSLDGVPASDVEAHLARVLASPAFRGAERSARLLRYIVAETLGGRADQLKDYTLGAEALGRGADFDPRTDPIARVEASRLRARLQVYYATEGTADEVRIVIAKGRYVPVFERRPVAMHPAAGATAIPDVPERGRERRAWPTLWLPVFTAALAGLATWWLARPQIPSIHSSAMRVELTTPGTTDPASLAVSPDGQSIVFAASHNDVPRLWLRRLENAEATPLAGTEHGSLPFWAPHGKSIGFFADGLVKSIDHQTRVVRILSTAPVPAGAAWNRDGVILHPLVPDSPLFKKAGGEGALAPATRLATGHTGHRGPVFLPDGRRFLFYAAGSADTRGVYLGALDSFHATRLLEADAPAVFAPPATLLYVQHTTLFARQFDPDTGVLAGDPVTLAHGMGVEPSSGLAAVAASATGRIAYRPGAIGSQRQFVWVDRQGGNRRPVDVPEERGPAYASISPDGRRLAVQRSTAGNTDIWLVDLERGPSVRFTAEPRADISPMWSPRADRIVYAGQVHGVFELFERGPDDVAPRLLLRDGQPKQVTDWSRDGRYLLYRSVSISPTPDTGIWALPLEGDRTPFVVLQTPFEERDAQFSPDGSWVAYQSNESGRHEVYVQPFRRRGERMRISTGGGVQVRWRGDGRELFYLRPDGQLMAVPVSYVPSRSALHAGTPVALFRTTLGALHGPALHSYIVGADGHQFLMDAVVEQQPAPIRLVLNWNAVDP